ncbi:MAG: hypothetical protein ACI8TX_002746 [Hyphomicrobiaceae bacterium]|jgi:hypothetical protein
MSQVRPGLSLQQKAFADAVFAPGSAPNQALLEELVPGGTLDRQGAVDVYRNGYTARLTEQLGETFEGVWWVLGDQEFFALCRAFISEHYSISYNLSDYGRELPSFIAATLNTDEIPFLPELAEFELAFTELFHRAEHAHLDAAGVAANIDAPSTRLEIGQCVFLRRHAYAVQRLWRLRKGPQAAAQDENWREDERLLGYKLNGEIFLRELDQPSFEALEALARGVELGEALAEVTARHPSFNPEAIQALFAIVFQTGIVSRVVTDPDFHRA